MKQQLAKKLASVLLWCAAGMLASIASAHEQMHGQTDGEPSVSVEEHAFGKQGDRKRIDRTIVIDMDDRMRFTPSELTVKQGETIRFVLKNSGKMLHEMVLGTMEILKAHHAMMLNFPGMEHDEPYMLHVPPGKRGTMIWQFTQAGEFHYACLIPGHFEAGMLGKIKVMKGKK